MRASYPLVALASALPFLLGTATASAHFVLMTPAPNNPGDASQGKGAPPCGPDAAAAANPTPAMGGHELMLSLKETVRHGGFYRVALSINARTEIPVDNVVYDSANKILPPDGMPSGTSDHADSEATPKFPVLADNLFPHPQDGAGNQVYTSMIMLPNVNCDHCTLQVIEFMTPHGYNGTAVAPGMPLNGGGYFYHHCADLKITADAAMPIFDPNGAAGGGSGGSSAGGSAATGGASAGMGGAGGATAGSGGFSAGGTGVTSGGIPGASGTTTTTTTGGTGTSTGGTGGTGTTTTGTGQSQDSGGCGIASRTQGGASALAALGLLFALVRRRRSA